MSVSGADDIMSLARDFGQAPGRAIAELDGIVQKAAVNIKKGMAEGAGGSPHFANALARSITYESSYRPGAVRYEIGPDKGRAGGALGNVYYFGTSRGGGTGDLTGPLNAEAPALTSHLEAAARRWALGGSP